MIYKNDIKKIDASGKTDFWAYAYCKQNDKVGNSLIAQPYKCRLARDRYRTKCYKLGSNGNVLKSGVVSIYSRNYADTYEEAIDGYNDLVFAHVDRLKKMCSDSMEDLLCLDKGDD